jgi:glycerophosphoryl diester phosphodiesterase
MDTIKVQGKGNIRMIAHRGVSGLERENTNAAFVAAGQRSYYGIETDVHVTKDGKFIVVHDDDLFRIAGIVGMNVEETEFEALRAVRLTDLDGSSRLDLCLPSLEEYIGICKKYDKQAILELKNPMPKEKVWELAELIKTMGWFERTTFISFAGENLVYLRERFASADAQFLTETCSEADVQFMTENKLDADLWGECVTTELVARLHSLGMKVNVWTLDTLEDAELAKAVGVDFITTNILE